MASAATASMATSARLPAGVAQADVDSFHRHLQGSIRILALLGAGLSASSGLPTFRGAGGFWRTFNAMELATPEAFEENPGLVWQFYSYRRHMALQASPNKAHFALAELAKQKPGFITLSQNVDGLSPRAGHPRSSLYLLHGSLFDIRCSSFYCDYIEEDNLTDPVVPALAIPTAADQAPTVEAAQEVMSNAFNERLGHDTELDISDASVQLPEVTTKDLPHCPKCNGLLRPGVVWFGEQLPVNTLEAVDDFIQEDRVDLMMVIGTSSRVYPAAGYTDEARAKGARVAIINTDQGDVPKSGLEARDWFFQGDAAEIVPLLLAPVIGGGMTESEKL